MLCPTSACNFELQRVLARLMHPCCSELTRHSCVTTRQSTSSLDSLIRQLFTADHVTEHDIILKSVLQGTLELIDREPNSAIQLMIKYLGSYSIEYMDSVDNKTTSELMRQCFSKSPEVSLSYELMEALMNSSYTALYHRIFYFELYWQRVWELQMKGCWKVPPPTELIVRIINHPICPQREVLSSLVNTLLSDSSPNFPVEAMSFFSTLVGNMNATQKQQYVEHIRRAIEKCSDITKLKLYKILPMDSTYA